MVRKKYARIKSKSQHNKNSLKYLYFTREISTKPRPKLTSVVSIVQFVVQNVCHLSQNNKKCVRYEIGYSNRKIILLYTLS